MKRKNVLTILLAVVSFIGIITCFIILNVANKASADGFITVDVINVSKEKIKEKEIGFHIGDDLVSLIEDNFDNVVFEDTGYGPFLLAIEGYQTPDDWSTYISIYVNNEYSLVGIKDIELTDGMYLSFRIEQFS